MTTPQWPVCRVCAGEGGAVCDPSLLHGVPRPVPLCACGHRLANHAPPDRHCLRRGCFCPAYARTEVECTCTELQRMTVCHDIRTEPHLVGCPRWGTRK